MTFETLLHTRRITAGRCGARVGRAFATLACSALFLLVAAPAWGQTTLYLRNGSGPISACTGTDLDMSASRGSSAQTYTLPGSASDNWSDTSMAGSTLNGAWDCTINVTVGSGSPQCC